MNSSRQCATCGNSFETRNFNKRTCSSECARIRKIELRKDRNGRTIPCKICGKYFPKRQGLCLYCDECNTKRITCPNCGGKKSDDHKHCNKCKKLSHTYYCTKCGKQQIGINNTKFCNECYPKCKICKKNTPAVQNGCCSQSCAQKYKWIGPSKELMYSHLTDMLNGVYNKGGNSKPNNKRKEFFDRHGIEYETEYRMKNNNPKLNRAYVFWDFKIENILIDINPTATHNITKPYRKGARPLSINSHKNKSLLAESQGFYPIQIFDWDNNDRTKSWILGLIKKNKRIYAKEIREVSGSEASKFCEKNHLQGSTSSTVWYGLYKGDQLYVLTGRGYDRKKDIWTLKRLCSLSGYYVAYGAKKLMDFFVKKHNPNIILSFSDITKHKGSVYDKLGFTLDGHTKPSYRWSDMKSKNVYRRRECQKKNIHRLKKFNGPCPYLEDKDNLFWRQTETQIMSGMGYVKVEDAGMRRHIWRKK